jgi:O-acetyl-ADP-ribose deacetylase (regulator of RNase III)
VLRIENRDISIRKKNISVPFFQEKELPHVIAKIGKKELPFILDSGSQISVISDLDLPKSAPRFKINTKLRGVTGNTLNVNEIALLRFSMKNKSFRHPFRIIPNFKFGPLIGTDFLKSHNSRILFDSNKVIFQRYGQPPASKLPEKNQIGKISEILTSKLTDETKSVFKVSRHIFLRPRTHTLVRLQKRQDISGRKNLLVPSVNLQDKLEIFIPSALVNKKVPAVWITNPTKKGITLYPNTVVGTAEDCTLLDEENDNEATSFQINVDTKFQAELKDKQALFDKTKVNVNPELSQEDKEKFYNLVRQFSDVFSWSEEDIGKAIGFEHEIKLSDNTPVSSPQYPIPYHLRDVVRAQLDLLLKQGVIRPSKSPWNSPILLVKKKNNSYRFITDARAYNIKSIGDRYPIPPIDDILTKMSGKLYMSAGDLKSGYFQAPLTENCKEITAFSVPGEGHFEYNCLPQGVVSSGAALNRLIKLTLAGVPSSNIHYYLDDFFLVSDTIPEMLDLLKILFERLRQRGLKLSPEKTKLAYTQLVVLGHKISKYGISVSDKIIESIQNYKTPKTKKQLKSFMGVASFVRRYVERFSEIVHPLQKLLKQSEKFSWKKEQSDAFEALKSAIINAPTLMNYHPNRPLYLFTDACGKGLAGVIKQPISDDNDAELVPIAFCSRKVSPSEGKLSTYQLELLAILYSLRSFRYFLTGRSFYLKTDNKAIVYLRQSKNINGKLARWLSELETYDFIISHVSGKNNNEADSLSRHVDHKRDIEDEIASSEDPRVFNIEEELQDFNIIEAQQKDPILKKIIQWLTNSEDKDPKFERQSYYYELRNNILYRKNKTANGPVYLLVIPLSLRHKVFSMCHENVIGANHGGFSKTYKLLLRSVYFTNMKKYIHQKVKECIFCQQNKKRQGLPYGILQTHPSVPPMYRIYLDIGGPYSSNNILKHKYLAVCIDEATKFCITGSLPDTTAASVAHFLYENVILKYGLFVELALDRGPAFTSNVFQELASMFNIKLKFCDVQAHFSIGSVENAIKNLEKEIKMCIDKNNPGSWIDYLASVTFSHNININLSMGVSPFEMLFGYTPRLTFNAALDIQFQENKDRLENLRNIRERAHNNLFQRFKTSSKSYNKRHKHVQFSEGQLVWIYDPRIKKGQLKAFSGKYIGPGKIMGKNNENSYFVKYKTGRGQEKIDSITIDRLKAYYKGENKDENPTDVLFSPVHNGTNEASQAVCNKNDESTEEDFSLVIKHVICMNDLKSWNEQASLLEKCNDESLKPKFAVNEEINSKVSLFFGSITQLAGDVIVNASNEHLQPLGGVDKAIHLAAGSELTKACSKLKEIKQGNVCITDGYNLPSSFVIHTCGPRDMNPRTLQSCYERSLKLCMDNDLKTIAFPNIATRAFGFSKEKACHIALSTIRKFLEENLDAIDRIVFCQFEKENQKLYEKYMNVYFPIRH